MKIVRFENGKFGIRKWNWSCFKWMLLVRQTGNWVFLEDVSNDRPRVEMTYDDANEWFDIIEANEKKKKPNLDRGYVVSRRKDQERITKGPSC